MSKCTTCKHCNLGKYHAGKWYCNSPGVSIFSIPVDMNRCFEQKEKRNGKTEIRG